MTRTAAVESVAQVSLGWDDPITADVIMHRLHAIPNLIDRNITKTAFSFLISEYKDFAVGMVSADGHLITQCRGGLPIFAANALCAAVKDGLAIFGEDELKTGDVVISNHAGTMGQHLNNVVMYTPIRSGDGAGALLGFFAVVMHWMDVGGIVVGSCQSPFTTDVFQEGIQFHTVKLLSEGKRVEDIFRIIRCNTRFPEEVMGDLAAQISGCLEGRDMVLEIVHRYGTKACQFAIERFWSASEANTRELIRSIPDGVYRASSFLDDDGIHRSQPVEINILITVQADTVTVDFSGVADQLQGPLNAGFEGGAVAAARIAAKYLFCPDGPANDGAFRPLKVVCPPGKFLSAGPTAPIGGSGFTIPSVVDTILRAFADVLPDRVSAGHHGTYSVHVIDGLLGQGRWFQHIESAVGGWGAFRGRDGTGPFRSMAHGDTLEVPIELQESAHPYRLEWFVLRQDSGGAGQYRGGLGIEKAYRILAPSNLTVSIERTKCAPWGLHGGKDAETGRIEVWRDDALLEVVTKGKVSLQAGDQVRLFTAGGGGYGDPLKRSHDAIRWDIDQDYVSEAMARRDYGFGQ